MSRLLIDRIHLKERIFPEIKRRTLIYLLDIFFIWPLISLVNAILSALHIPYYSTSLGDAIILTLGGMAVMVPDILIVGIIGSIVSLAFFSLLASLRLIVRTSYRISLIIEPMILFGAVVLGTSLYYPSVLSEPVFLTLGILPVWALTLILVLMVIVWSALLASPNHRISVVAVVLAFSVLAPLPTLYRNRKALPVGSVPPTVLLGIDSISLTDDLSHIEHWVRANGGAWYTRAVSPGLLTNAVWSSILLFKPVREHRVFHTFQSSPGPLAGPLLEEAKRQGYYTVSVFSDQLTCWVGSDYSFDLDRSGPIGWRQLATTIFENASILVPLLKPILPRLPFSSVPPNHAGSYTYSIEREFNEILSQSSSRSATLVIGHSTYLHVPVYPKYLDLSWEECRRVLRSPAYLIKDRSFDWQDTDRPDDAVPLRQWKVRRVQTALTDAIGRTKFIERGGKMILLSDHGDRIGISGQNFREKRYHNVMFATFGLPVRDTNLPISTLDSGSLLGLSQHKPFAPVVEFAVSEPSEWPPLVYSAKLEWSGRVHLDNDLLSHIFERLRSYQPWSNLKEDGKIHAVPKTGVLRKAHPGSA